jgi:hypothetical protein
MYTVSLEDRNLDTTIRFPIPTPNVVARLLGVHLEYYNPGAVFHEIINEVINYSI